MGRAPIFTNEEKLQFVAHITISNCGFPVDMIDLRCIVKSYLDRCRKKEVRFKNNYPRKDYAKAQSSLNPETLTTALVSTKNSATWTMRTHPWHHIHNPKSLQNLTVGLYILVNYEGELYPRKITEMKNNDKILITAMQKSGAHWKWPTKPNEIYYSKDKIVQLIKQTKELGLRDIYSVEELRAYNC